MLLAMNSSFGGFVAGKMATALALKDVRCVLRIMRVRGIKADWGCGLFGFWTPDGLGIG